MMTVEITPDLTFEMAADRWLASLQLNAGRARYVQKGTLTAYRIYLIPLNRYFSAMPLKKITVTTTWLSGEAGQRKAGTPRKELFGRYCRWQK